MLTNANISASETAESILLGARRTYMDAAVSQAMNAIATLIEESAYGLIWEVEMDGDDDPESVNALGAIRDLASEIRKAAEAQQAG